MTALPAACLSRCSAIWDGTRGPPWAWALCRTISPSRSRLSWRFAIERPAERGATPCPYRSRREPTFTGGGFDRVEQEALFRCNRSGALRLCAERVGPRGSSWCGKAGIRWKIVERNQSKRLIFQGFKERGSPYRTKPRTMCFRLPYDMTAHRNLNFENVTETAPKRYDLQAAQNRP